MLSRLKNLILLLRCFARFLVQGKADNVKSLKEYELALVWQNAKLGDMVCTTPLFRAITKHFPGYAAPIYLSAMGARINGEVLAGSTDVTNYIIKSKNYTENIESVRNLRPDVAFLCTPDFEALATLYLARVPLVVAPRVVGGWSPYETTSYRLLSHLVVRAPHHMYEYAPREYLRLLEPLGIKETDTTKHLSCRPSPLLDDEKGKFLVGISPGAGNKIKNWGGEKFATVADYLIEKYKAQVVVFGGPADREEVSSMLESVKNKNSIINLADRINVEQLKEAISKLNLFIAVDTGPIYIAEAFGVPTIDIVGPMDEREQPPRGPLHLVVIPPERKRAELHIMNARSYDKVEARRQIDSISVDMVTKASDELLTQIKI